MGFIHSWIKVKGIPGFVTLTASDQEIAPSDSMQDVLQAHVTCLQTANALARNSR
jgi:hypothetical protein